MDSLSEKKILETLDITQFLTIRVVARLFYAVRRDGTPAKGMTTKPFVTSKKSYPLEPGYYSAKWMLNNMTKKTVLTKGRERPMLQKFESENRVRPDIYFKPGAQIHNEDLTYGHDMAIVVSYALLTLTGELIGFQRYWDKDQREEYGKKWGLYPDGVFALKANPDHMIFLEVDGGTEWEKSQIKEKCEEYVAFGNAHPGLKFTVIFPTKGAYGMTDEVRMDKMLDVFASFKRQNMFLTTTWDKFIGDLKLMDGKPLNPIFKSPWQKPHNPLDPNFISLLDVVRTA